LDRWAYAFEKNSIATSISISLSKIGKSEVINAIVENIEEIGKPLQNYISKNDKSKERLINQNTSSDVYFDILVDDTKIDKVFDENGYFKKKVQEYGAVIAKIERRSSAIDADYVRQFVQHLVEYVKKTNNFVGLALLIGNEYTSEAKQIMNSYSNKSIGYLIAIEKPLMLDTSNY
jgi:hypothetical protein